MVPEVPTKTRAPVVWCGGSQPKHVVNPDPVIKKFQPHCIYDWFCLDYMVIDPHTDNLGDYMEVDGASSVLSSSMHTHTSDYMDVAQTDLALAHAAPEIARINALVSWMYGDSRSPSPTSPSTTRVNRDPAATDEGGILPPTPAHEAASALAQQHTQQQHTVVHLSARSVGSDNYEHPPAPPQPRTCATSALHEVSILPHPRHSSTGQVRALSFSLSLSLSVRRRSKVFHLFLLPKMSVLWGSLTSHVCSSLHMP